MEKTPTLYSPSDIRTSNMLSDRSSDLDFGDEKSLTQQQFADECDINNIVAKNPDGFYTHLNSRLPLWGVDVPESMVYNEALNLVQQANASFMAMPADLRARFNNDPSQLLAFLGDDSNYDEAVSLGFIAPKASPTPTTSTPVDKTSEKPSDAA